MIQSEAARTGKRVDVDDRVLTRLVVDDDVDAEQGHPQRLPQRPGQLPDDIIAGRLGHALHVLPLRPTGGELKKTTNITLFQQ